MKLMKHLPIFATLFIAISIIGCSGAPHPDGLPKLYSCTITIKQDGKPLEGAGVQLYDPTVTNRWTVSGVTNASGVAVIRTHGNFVGAPSGRFKVIVSKTVMEGGGGYDDTVPQKERKPLEPTRVYSLVGKEYTSRETTPLEIIIDSKKKSETFDLGTAERILIQTIKPGDI